jgi:hypothetical protein
MCELCSTCNMLTPRRPANLRGVIPPTAHVTGRVWKMDRRAFTSAFEKVSPQMSVTDLRYFD